MYSLVIISVASKYFADLLLLSENTGYTDIPPVHNDKANSILLQISS